MWTLWRARAVPQKTLLDGPSSVRGAQARRALDLGVGHAYDLGVAEYDLAGTGGSFYALCWGHDPASGSGELVVRIGTLTLVGAARGSWGCTLGLACELDVPGESAGGGSGAA